MKKRVLFLIPNLKHGGAEKVLVNLVNNLDPDKYQITVQTLFDVGVHKDSLLPHIRYLPGWKRTFRGSTTLMKLFPPAFLWRHLVKEQYDIAVSYLEGPTSRIISGCPDPDTKKIAWVHIELSSPRKAAIGFRSVREAAKCYNRCHRIIAVSQTVRDHFVSNLKVATPISVLYNTNETGQIRQNSVMPPCDPDFAPEGEFSVCSVAKLTRAKGFDRLIHAHKRLLEDGLKHHIYILGIGKLHSHLQRQIRNLGVEKTVTLLGYRTNPYQYVSRCQLYVCSSRREGFSTAVTEALIVGTPVVSTNCSGAKELLGQRDEYGLVVENSAEGIYQGMKRMLSDPELLAHYRKKATLRGSFFRKETTVWAVEEMLENL